MPKMFGNYLKRARVEAKLSQNEVSEKLNYTTPQFISNWERGISTPPIKELKSLSSLYSIKPEIFLDVFIQSKLHVVENKIRSEFKKSK